jgi:septal ring factor EnvC (AmiA/AmiB activator)
MANSIAERIKQQSSAYAPQAKELELDRLRQDHGILVAAHKLATDKNDDLEQQVTDCESEIATLLEFISESDIEITEAVADIIAKREELRIKRRLMLQVLSPGMNAQRSGSKP